MPEKLELPARATVIADASFCPHTRAAGWAVWININWPDGRHQRLKRSGTFRERPRDPAEAEKWAVFNGVWLAYQTGARNILAQTDCLQVVKEAASYQETALQHWPDASLRLKHVKGHTGGRCPDGGDNRRFFVNEWCDNHAKKHMRKQRDEHRKISGGSG